MKIIELRKKLMEWLEMSAEANDAAVGKEWRNEDVYDEGYWAPNGWRSCGFSDEEAEYIEENEDFFGEIVEKVLKTGEELK